MSELHTATEFEYALKNTLVRTLVDSESNGLDRQELKSALNETVSAEYRRVLAPIEAQRDAAATRGNAIASDAYETAYTEAHETLMDEMGDVFAAGFARLNRALDALQDGSITFEVTEYDETATYDGVADLDNYGLNDGDTLVVMQSRNSGSTYPQLPTAGHSTCACHDKLDGDRFPVCKHEMVWLISQVLLSLPDGRRDAAVNAVESAATTPPMMAKDRSQSDASPSAPESRTAVPQQ